MSAPTFVSTVCSKADNCHGFLIASLDDKSLPGRGRLVKERKLCLGEKIVFRGANSSLL